MKFINMTPHEVTIYRDGKEPLVIAPSGLVARVEKEYEECLSVDDIPCRKETGKFREVVTGLPYSCDIAGSLWSFGNGKFTDSDGIKAQGFIVIMSGECLKAHHRCDWYIPVAPDTNPESAIRDENGRIIGVRGFITK